MTFGAFFRPPGCLGSGDERRAIGESRIAELEETSTPDTEEPAAHPPGVVETDTEDEIGVGESTQTTVKESDKPAIEPAGRASQPLSPPTGSQPGSVDQQTSASTTGPPKTANAAADEGSRQPAAGPPPPQIQALPPTGTVVLAVGDRLLAARAESYFKARLERAGVEIIDVTSIPGLEGLINTESRPGPEKFRAALEPHARYLVPIRVEYQGSRDIVYMGQRDQVHSARIHIAAVDLATGRPLGRPADITVEYTQLNAEEVVGEKLRRAATDLLQQLPRE